VHMRISMRAVEARASRRRGRTWGLERWEMRAKPFAIRSRHEWIRVVRPDLERHLRRSEQLADERCGVRREEDGVVSRARPGLLCRWAVTPAQVHNHPVVGIPSPSCARGDERLEFVIETPQVEGRAEGDNG